MKFFFKIGLIFLTFLSFLPNHSLANQDLLNLSEVKNNFSSPNIIGKYHLKVFGFNIYQIALISDHKEFSYKNKVAILINYERAFAKNKLLDKSIEEIKRINNIKDESLLSDYRQKLSQIFCDVRKGDRKLAFFDPQSGLKLYFNGSLMGQINDKILSQRFIDIWLSDKSSYPKMTANILGINLKN